MNELYKAPEARVADTELGPRPREINVALVLIALLVVVECYYQYRDLALVNNGEMSGLGWLVGCVWIVGTVVSGWMIARGRNWARWIFLIVALNLIYRYAVANPFAYGFGSPFDLLSILASVWLPRTAPMLAIVALILIFGPGRRWFRPSE